MDRDQAKKLISGLFDEAVDDIETERLESMSREIRAQMKAARSKGIYGKVVAALDTEIEARLGGEAAERIRPQTPAETEVAGGPEDKPGEMRRGGSREPSMKWRVTGR